MGSPTPKFLENYLSSGNAVVETVQYFHTRLGEIALFSRPSPDNDKPNEDHLAVFPVGPQSLVLAIADGVGGQNDGITAAFIAIREIRHAIARIEDNGKELRGAILDGIENANHSILENTAGAACTIAIVEINEQIVRTYHAGDSEVLITGQRGRLKHQTLSHTPVAYAMEAGLMNEDQAIMHEERHIVSNVLGYRDMHITISSPIKMACHDTLLVGSDGLFDNLHKQEIVEIIRKGKLSRSGEILAEKVRARMFSDESCYPSKFDDLSFILFRQNRSTPS